MKYAISVKKPSEMFIDALEGGGASSVYCNCGRQHYAPENLLGSDDETDYPNMLADVTAEKEKNPDGVIIHEDTSFVYAKDIDNTTYVVECPCNGLTKYEEFIWKNKDSIRRYLKTRIEQEYRWAEEQLTLNKLAGI
jgi:hypothetical protein